MAETNREIELRLIIRDPAALRAALLRAGARVIGEGLVRTTTFDFPDRRLRGGRQSLRLREDWTGTTLTSKVPLNDPTPEQGDGTRTRDEIHLPLPDGAAAQARELLLSIGLLESLSYDKQRTSWQVGAARVDVDVLADGGACYAEIEAQPDVIAATRTRLGLADTPVEMRSYFEIVNLARAR